MPEDHLFLRTGQCNRPTGQTGQLGTFLECFEDNLLNTSSRLLIELVETFPERFHNASKWVRVRVRGLGVRVSPGVGGRWEPPH